MLVALSVRRKLKSNAHGNARQILNSWPIGVARGHWGTTAPINLRFAEDQNQIESRNGNYM